MARPSKLTPEAQRIIVQAISIGASYADAAHAANIDYNTFNEWRKKGEKQKKGEYREFNEAVRKEEAEAALRHLTIINNAAAKGDWKASLEWLRRRRRQDWGDNVNVDVTTNGKNINEIGVRIVDYRHDIAPTAGGSEADSESPSQDESTGDGSPLG